MRAAWLATIAALLIARTAVADAALLAQVPADTVSFVGIDLGKARGSAALTTVVTRLIRATGLDDHTVAFQSAGSLVIAGVPGTRIPALIERGSAAHDAVAFGAIWLDASTQRRLAQVLPDLGGIQWLAGTLERSPAGFSLAGSAAFADPYVAARIAVAIGMGRKVVTAQLPAKVAAAVDKIAIIAMGSSIRISATWTEADVAALTEAAR